MTRAEAQEFIRNKIRAEVGDFRGSQSEAARRWGVPPQSLSLALMSDKGFLGPAVRKAVGLEVVMTASYEVKDI